MRCLTDCFLLQILSNRETLSWPGGGGVLLGVLVGVVPPGSPDPDPISDQKMYFSTLVFRLDLENPYPFLDLAFRQKLFYHYLNWRADKKNTSNPHDLEFSYFSFFPIHLELKR